MSNEAESAGYIAAAVAAFVAGILKLRTVMSGDRRKIAHDDNATKWEASLLEENDSLRKALADMDTKNRESWERHVQDAQKISRLETELHYVREEVARLQSNVALISGKGTP